MLIFFLSLGRKGPILVSVEKMPNIVQFSRPTLRRANDRCLKLTMLQAKREKTSIVVSFATISNRTQLLTKLKTSWRALN